MQVVLTQSKAAGELFRRKPLVVLWARRVLLRLRELVEVRLLRIRHFEMQCDPRQQKRRRHLSFIYRRGETGLDGARQSKRAAAIQTLA